MKWCPCLLIASLVTLSLTCQLSWVWVSSMTRVSEDEMFILLLLCLKHRHSTLWWFLMAPSTTLIMGAKTPPKSLSGDLHTWAYPQFNLSACHQCKQQTGTIPIIQHHHTESYLHVTQRVTNLTPRGTYLTPRGTHLTPDGTHMTLVVHTWPPGYIPEPQRRHVSNDS